MPKPSTPTTKDKDKPRKSSGSISTPKKSPLKSSQEGWWEADEILDQKGKRFLVSWVGTNPETGRGYSPTWVYSLFVCAAVVILQLCFNCLGRGAWLT